MNEQRIDLDVSKALVTRHIRLGQGDVSGTTIVASVYDNGAPLPLSGCTAEFEMRMPGGTKYARDDRCTVSGNAITYVVDESHVCAVAGTSEDCYFNIRRGSDLVASTSRFTVHVLRSAHADAAPVESWDSYVERFIRESTAAAESYDAAERVRAEAESGRLAAEQARARAEAERSSAEAERSSAESGRTDAEAQRQANERQRVSAEAGRADAEGARAGEFATLKAESQAATGEARAQAESSAEAQAANDAAQAANSLDQARNNADQARNNAAAASGYVRYLEEGEYDPDTGRPTIDAGEELRMCVSPNPDGGDLDNLMLEWARRRDGEAWGWELVGGTGWRPTPATTEQADEMVAGTQVTSNATPDATWVSYYTAALMHRLASATWAELAAM